MDKVLVIGGAGFVGSHTVDALLASGYSVRIADALDPQVHPNGAPPEYLNRDAEFTLCDVRDRDSLRKSLDGIHSIFYFAGAVGVGDSMYRIRHYADANLLGAANLLDILANESHSSEKIVLSSSVTVYGEGKYHCPDHGVVFPNPQLQAHRAAQIDRWDPLCPIRNSGLQCLAHLTPLLTDEEKPPAPQSVYAVTKKSQEDLFLNVCKSYGIGIAVLRYFNIFGPRQSLSNPYTGVAKLFAAALSSGQSPTIYEDGLQTRDFVNIRDVVQANLLALQKPQSNGEIFNVGSGVATSILDLSAALANITGFLGELKPSNRSRAGDTRHCCADISKIKTLLGYEPRHILPAGLEDVVQWSATADQVVGTHQAERELRNRGLISDEHSANATEPAEIAASTSN